MARDGAHPPWRHGLVVTMLLLLGGCRLIGSVVSTAVNTAAAVAIPAAGAKAMMACIPEGMPVDTPLGPVAIEALRVGDPVIGFDGEPVRILQIHAYAEDPATEFLVVEFEDGARVELCGMHRLGGVRAGDLAPADEVTGRRVRSATAFTGVERSYDLLTEDAGYRIRGIPVNSMIEEMMAVARTGRAPTEE